MSCYFIDSTTSVAINGTETQINITTRIKDGIQNNKAISVYHRILLGASRRTTLP